MNKIQKFIKDIRCIWRYDFVRQKIAEYWLFDYDIFRFYIYDDGIETPVFHLVPMQTYNDICICLFEPRLYQYRRETDVLTPFIHLDELDKVLREQNKEKPDMSNWETLVYWWKMNNSNVDYPDEYDTMKQPDYTKLKDNPPKRRSFSEMLVAKWYA